MARKKSEFVVRFLVFLFIVALISGLALSAFSFLYYVGQRKNQEALFNNLNRKINALSERISKLEATMAQIQPLTNTSLLRTFFQTQLQIWKELSKKYTMTQRLGIYESL